MTMTWTMVRQAASSSLLSQGTALVDALVARFVVVRGMDRS
jgi:hypothetical protein